MKANELRIGNYVTLLGKITKVSPIMIAEEYQSGLCSSDYLEDIPLTEKWLLKFGFDLIRNNKDSGYKQYENYTNGFTIMFSIEVNEQPVCWVESIGLDVMFVHQLQNLYFALTGKELTII